MKADQKKFYLHLVSDATGTTLLGLARACLAQFGGIEPIQKFWPLVRTQKQLERIISTIETNPGPVIFTLVDEAMRKRLQDRCEELGVPCVAVLDPIIRSLSSYLGMHAKGVPGLQHALDDAYFRRVSAIEFAMRYDDGKKQDGLREADVILVGVSRTSKTPTCVYLARSGIKAANIPLVPGVEIAEEKFKFTKPLYVGLTAAPARLAHIRRSRLRADSPEGKAYDENAYLDAEKIEEEVRIARRLFSRHGWPVIDVTKRSVEETAAEVLALLQAQQEQQNG
ncbi:MAG: kinase/pyrophosphorylase [Alphaproteobacteria bacterium]|nr:kinase/pyrophosphorylase [Alphaproteobacteria bacterium]